jgi:hypothetical protein
MTHSQIPRSDALKDASERKIENRYVGFCDILGFSDRILNDFDKTLELYESFADRLTELPQIGIETTLYSDAILITSHDLAQVLKGIQVVWHLALFNDLMFRGAVTWGRYWEQRRANQLLIASDALTRAVKLEKSISVPAVVIADDVEIPDDLWLCRFARDVLSTHVLHFRHRNIVNPFMPNWFQSARMRALQLMEASPSHKDKYLWFLSLHDSVNRDEPLIPPRTMERFLLDGSLVVESGDGNTPTTKPTER